MVAGALDVGAGATSLPSGNNAHTRGRLPDGEKQVPMHSVSSRGINEDCGAGREGQDSVSDNEGGDERLGCFLLDISGLVGGVRCFLFWELSGAGCCRAVCGRVATRSVCFSSGVKKLDSRMGSSSSSAEHGVNRGRETHLLFSFFEGE